jgi:hypothetical protein
VIVEISTVLNSSADRVWDEVQKTNLLKYVAYPLLKFEPLTPIEFPAVWQSGKYLVKLKAFGCIPLGRQCIVISQPDSDSGPSLGVYQIRDDGYGDIVTKWDHQITIRSTPGGLAQYTDRVEVRAGLLTPFIWLYAHIFYRYRQYRWRRLIRNDFHYD